MPPSGGFKADCCLFKPSEWSFNDEPCDVVGRPELQVAVSEEVINLREKKMLNHPHTPGPCNKRYSSHDLRIQKYSQQVFEQSDIRFYLQQEALALCD